MLGTLVGRYRTAAGDVKRTPAADAEREDIVLLEEIPDTRTRVSVTVQFEGDESAAAHLDRDLRLFKTFAETRG